MNWLGITAIVLGFTAFFITAQFARRHRSTTTERFFLCIMALAALPAAAYAVYYTRLLGEPVWLYRMRTPAGSELLAAPAGLLAGWMHVRMVPHLKLSAAGRILLFPLLLGTGLALPYLKPLLRPLSTNALSDEWSGGACIQSTPSTCGPASAATILHHFGYKVSEAELASEAFTSSSGTENWYLARALQRRKFGTSFIIGSPAEVQVPAIAGVRLLNHGNAGHFIALLNREGDKVVFNDPLEGMSTNSIADLTSKHAFTGFFLVVQPKHVSE